MYNYAFCLIKPSVRYDKAKGNDFIYKRSWQMQCFIKRIGYYQTVAGNSDKSSQQQEKEKTTTKDADKARRMITAAFHYKSDLLDKWEI